MFVLFLVSSSGFWKNLWGPPSNFIGRLWIHSWPKVGSLSPSLWKPGLRLSCDQLTTSFRVTSCQRGVYHYCIHGDDCYNLMCMAFATVSLNFFMCALYYGELIVVVAFTQLLQQHPWVFVLRPQSLRSYPKLVVSLHDHKEMNISELTIFHLYLTINSTYEEGGYTYMLYNEK